MNVLRLWAVVYGPTIVLALPGATNVSNDPGNTLWLSNQTSMFTWMTGLVMGAQLVAVIGMLIRGIWLRRIVGPSRRSARTRQRD